MSPSIKCDYLVSRPFRRGVWRSSRGRININSATKRREWQLHNSTAHKTLGAPKQLTFQLISLNPLQNKLRLSHWKERHRLMDVRMKREELTDWRTRIPCQAKDNELRKTTGTFRTNPRCVDIMQGKTRSYDHKSKPKLLLSSTDLSLSQLFSFHFCEKLITHT
jgi:hypothetical protein